MGGVAWVTTRMRRGSVGWSRLGRGEGVRVRDKRRKSGAGVVARVGGNERREEEEEEEIGDRKRGGRADGPLWLAGRPALEPR